MFQFFLFLTCAERIVSSDLMQMARIVKGVDADIISSANFKSIDSAV